MIKKVKKLIKPAIKTNKEALKDNKSEYILVADNVFKEYSMQGNNSVSVLKGISLSIKKGESVALVGESGSGKSTLLQILGILDSPTSGQVYIDGISVFDSSEVDQTIFRAKYVGFVYQFHHLLPEFSAIENIVIPQLLIGASKDYATERAKYLLDSVGLLNRAEHNPSALSGGEQQRVALARSLANSPKILLADEPTGNLDTANAKNITNLLLEIAKQEETCLLIATHSNTLAESLSKTIKIVDGVIF